MARALTLLNCALLLFHQAKAQPDTIPDFYGEPLYSGASFIPALGQVVTTNGGLLPDLRFYSAGGSPRLYMHRNSIMSLVLGGFDTSMVTLDTLGRIDLELVGQFAQQVDPVVHQASGPTYNYFLPWCGPGGITGVRGYSMAVYKNVYPGIDLRFYGGRSGQKMAFICWPGSNPANILLQFTGQDSLGIDVQGILRAYLQQRWIDLPEAVAYQVDSNEQVIPLGWTASYQHQQGTAVVAFQFDTYSDQMPLVLQVGPPPPAAAQAQTPGVCWSSYLGGDGNEDPRACGLDALGNFYVAGSTWSTELSFPVIEGQVYTTGFPTLFTSRFDEQDSLHWSSWFGGSVGSQDCSALAVSNDVPPLIYVGGRSNTPDFHIEYPGGGLYIDSTGVGGFIARFNTSGLLTWSTCFGATGNHVHGLAFDKHERLVATGSTQGYLPTPQLTPPASAEQWTYQGEQDAFIALFTDSLKLLWCTPFGGAGFDVAYDVDGGPNNIVIAGYTFSDTIPIQAAPGATPYNQGIPAGNGDCFIAEFNLDGELVWCTFFGGTSSERLGFQGLSIDKASGDIVIAGGTNSDDLPFVAGANWSDSTSISPIEQTFIAHFSWADHSLKWSTYISGSASSSAYSVVHDEDGVIFVSGRSVDDQFPTQPAWGLYHEDTEMGTGDGFIMCFGPDHHYQWGTLFGGVEGPLYNSDVIVDMAVKHGQRLYALGWTTAAYDQGQFFPLTDPQTNAWFDEVLGFPSDAFVSAFCIGGIVGLADAARPHAGAQLLQDGTGHCWINGLPMGRHTLQVFDAVGRIVMQRTVYSSGAEGVGLDIRPLSNGAYVVAVPGVLSQLVILRR